ncbi:NADH oxidase [Streptomyces sp. NPDC050560]|uniref:NADH oxidase n=1 Tax=Streptomyces sp. NPDC050560 TaxID=3365630 RepID=UPI0037966A84
MPGPPSDGRPLHLWSLCEDVVVEPGEQGDDLVLTGRFGQERIRGADATVREALRRMELGPVLLANVEARTEPGSGRPPDTYLVMLPVLSRLSHLVVRTLGMDDMRGPLLSVSPLSRTATFTPAGLSPRRPLRLPEGATLTLEKTGFALEASGAEHRVVLHRPEAVWVVGLLAWPVTPEGATAALPLPPDITTGILDYLAAAGMASPSPNTA